MGDKGLGVVNKNQQIANKLPTKLDFLQKVLHLVNVSVIICVSSKKGEKEWRHKKKRIVISLSDERAEEFEKLVRESGLTKSGLVTTWIFKRNRKVKKNKKRATAMALKSKILLGYIILYG